MFAAETINLIAFIIFCICICLYSVKLIYWIKKPITAKRGILNIFYGLWVKRMMDPQETLVAIQTMRNLIMATTFLSSSMLLLLGLLISLPDTGMNGLMPLAPTSTEIIAQFKLIIFVAVIIFSIIMFLLSLRQMVRFSILIGIPCESLESISLDNIKTKKNVSKKKCSIDAEFLRTDIFLRAMNRFTFGMRAVFYGITIILWFLNVYVFIVGTICLTFFLIVYQDATPPSIEHLTI